MSLPLWARPNSVIPIGTRSDRPDYDYSGGITLHVYQLEDNRNVRVEIPSVKGNNKTTFDITRKGNDIRIWRQGPPKKWNVTLHVFDEIRSFGADEHKNELMIQLA